MNAHTQICAAQQLYGSYGVTARETLQWHFSIRLESEKQFNECIF